MHQPNMTFKESINRVQNLYFQYLACSLNAPRIGHIDVAADNSRIRNTEIDEALFSEPKYFLHITTRIMFANGTLQVFASVL